MTLGASALGGAALKLLIDTNLLIAAEDISAGSIHVFGEAATRLLGIAGRDGHPVFVSGATRDDLARAATPALLEARRLQLQRYQQLERIPSLASLQTKAGYPPGQLSPNDLADLEVLAAIDVGAVDLVVTQDQGLRRHAAMAGFAAAVLSVHDAIDLLSGLSADYVARPTLMEMAAYAVDAEDHIFDSIRLDYGQHDPPFEQWWEKCRGEHRRCLVISSNGPLDAIAVLKQETSDTWGLPEPVLKVCLFKVADHATGSKRGELLLDGILQWGHAKYGSAFVEVFPRHEQTRALFEAFGFDMRDETVEGELVLSKQLRPGPQDRERLSAWEYHRRFGPPAVKIDRAFVVPVQQRWHDILFPEIAATMELFGPRPPGNAFTKAYLTRSRITTLKRGDTLLFYRSQREQGITAIGVVEDVQRPGSAEQVVALAGARTVYTRAEVEELVGNSHGELAVVLFRRDRVLTPYLSSARLRAEGVLNGPPQSITQVHSEEGLRWLRSQISA